MSVKTGLISAALLSICAACNPMSESTYPLCGKSAESWPIPGDEPGELVIAIPVTLTADNLMRWNDDSITDAQLSSNLEIVDTVYPSPRINLVIAEGTQCKRVEQVRKSCAMRNYARETIAWKGPTGSDSA